MKKISDNNITSLIIDIRRNGGGNSSLGDLLTCYITDKKFTTFSRVEEKVSRQSIDNYKKYFEQQGLLEKMAVVFSGDVYVPIRSNTFSSSTDFSAVIKDYELGTLIGEETSGLATCYGDIYSFDLSNTKLHAGVSFKYFVRPSGEDTGRGVIPHYTVTQSIEDTKKDIDTVMEFTKKLIKNKNTHN